MSCRCCRRGILSGKYRPGDRLNESQIARELNISRIPVREALSQLQEQGLVQNRERRGMFVTNITPAEVLQISSLRLILETEALRLARTRMTPEILAELEALVAQMENWDGIFWTPPPWICSSTARCGGPPATPIWSARCTG